MCRQHIPIKLLFRLKIIVINVMFTLPLRFLSGFFGVITVIWITFLRLVKKD